jgi:hypothetical protein
LANVVIPEDFNGYPYDYAWNELGIDLDSLGTGGTWAYEDLTDPAAVITSFLEYPEDYMADLALYPVELQSYLLKLISDAIIEDPALDPDGEVMSRIHDYLPAYY